MVGPAGGDKVEEEGMTGVVISE